MTSAFIFPFPVPRVSEAFPFFLKLFNLDFNGFVYWRGNLVAFEDGKVFGSSYRIGYDVI